MPDGGAGAEDDPVDVDAHDAAVHVVGQVGDVGVADGDPRVQIGDAEPAELVDAPGEGRVDLGGVADVGAHEQAADRVGDGTAGDLVPVDDADPHALGREALDGRPADARRRAGHEPDLPRQVHLIHGRESDSRPGRRFAAVAGRATEHGPWRAARPGTDGRAGGVETVTRGRDDRAGSLRPI